MREKKYHEIVNLMGLTEEGRPVDVLNNLRRDWDGDRKLVSEVYSITTSGGNEILWRVNQNKGGQIYTVSTDSVENYVVRKGGYSFKVPKFIHYVLTDEGLTYVQGCYVASDQAHS